MKILKKPISIGLPFFSKSLIPGGVITFENGILYKPNQIGKKLNEEGINLIKSNVVCGDILSFDYISREIPKFSDATSLKKDETSVLNPLVVFSSFDPTKKLIYGVDLRKFKLSQQDSMAEKLFFALRKYYYVSEFDEKGNEFLRKKDIGLPFFILQDAFLYKNFSSGFYAPVFPLLKKYYRSYNIFMIRKCLLVDIVTAELFYSQTAKVAPGALP